VGSNSLSVQRRRSERVSESLPVVVRGVDLLGQPFEERTATVNLNLHGCRYSSKYQLPRNSWVTLELLNGEERRNVRARVAWILRPHSIRDFFQVAVELEGPANVWGVEAPPADWMTVPISSEYFTSSSRGLEAAGDMSVNFMEGPAAPMTEPYGEYVSEFQAAPQPVFDTHDLNPASHEQPSQESSASSPEQDYAAPSPQSNELLSALRAELDHLSAQVRAMIDELEQKASALHAERDAASELLTQLGDARQHAEAATAAHASLASEAQAGVDAEEQRLARWRDRLAQEMAVAQAQWSELLQSSLDRGLGRLSEQLPERTRQAVHEAEEKMAEQAAILAQAAAQISSQAQDTLSSVRASVDQELWKARDLLENSRSEAIERAASETASRIGSHVNQVNELLRDLSGREEQAAESLRLHRERLRQVSDNTLRDIGSHIEGATSQLRESFDAVKSEALAKWNEDLEVAGARAAQSAGESIGRTSEWLQQEATARLQVLVEQNVAGAAASLQEESSKAHAHFSSQLEGHSSFHLAQAHQQLDGVANELTSRSRNQIAEAAEAAASSFGQVIHDMSTQRTQQFSDASQQSLSDTKQHFEWFTQQLRTSFESDSTAAMENMRWQVASHLESTVGDARSTLTSESSAILDAHRAERDARQQEVSSNLTGMANNAVAMADDRLRSAAESWTAHSARRLNEHGQGLIESLTRSTDEAVRESASRIFENLVNALRQPQAAANPPAPSESGTYSQDPPPDFNQQPQQFENYSS
jgi:hypothetical protein